VPNAAGRLSHPPDRVISYPRCPRALLAAACGRSPRPLDFLYSRNRLNVAVSRARCFAVVLASPKLLDVQCKTPELMRALNAFCQLLEASRGVVPAARTTPSPWTRRTGGRRE
jgi:hypothetical protein